MLFEQERNALDAGPTLFSYWTSTGPMVTLGSHFIGRLRCSDGGLLFRPYLLVDGSVIGRAILLFVEKEEKG